MVLFTLVVLALVASSQGNQADDRGYPITGLNINFDCNNPLASIAKACTIIIAEDDPTREKRSIDTEDFEGTGNFHPRNLNYNSVVKKDRHRRNTRKIGLGTLCCNSETDYRCTRNDLSNFCEPWRNQA